MSVYMYVCVSYSFCAIVYRLLQVLNHVAGCTTGMMIKGKEVNKNEGIGRIRKF